MRDCSTNSRHRHHLRSRRSLEDADLRRRYLRLLVPAIARINGALRHAPAANRARAVRRAADRCLLQAAAMSPSASLAISRRFICSPSDDLRTIIRDACTIPRRTSSSSSSPASAHRRHHEHIHNRIHTTTTAKIKRRMAHISYIKALRSSRSSHLCCRDRSNDELGNLITNASQSIHIVSGAGNNRMQHEQQQQSSHGGAEGNNNDSTITDYAGSGSRQEAAIAITNIPNQEELSRLQAVIFSDHQSLLIDHYHCQPSDYGHRRPLLQANRAVGHRNSASGDAGVIATVTPVSRSLQTNSGSRGADNHGSTTVINPATLLSQAAHYILALQLQVDTLQALLNPEISPPSS